MLQWNSSYFPNADERCSGTAPTFLMLMNVAVLGCSGTAPTFLMLMNVAVEQLLLS